MGIEYLDPEALTIGPRGQLAGDETAGKPGWALGEAFATHNTIGAVLTSDPVERSWEPGTDFNVVDHLWDTPYEQFIDDAIGIGNESELQAWKTKVDQEQSKRAIIGQAGWRGVVSSVAAGTLDPMFLVSLLVPGGAAIRSGNALRGAVSTSLAAGVGASAAELSLDAIQSTRPKSEIVGAIAGALVLGAIGGGAAARLSRQEMDDLTKQVTNALLENVDELPESGVGAMVSRTTASLEQQTLERAAGLEKALPPGKLGRGRHVNPLLRLFNSPLSTVRSITADLAENPFFFMKNRIGMRNANAVETMMKVTGDGLRGEWHYALRAAYKSTRKSPDRLKFKDFKQEVSRAMRRGDQHAIPEVQQAAQAARRLIFEPIAKRAQRAGMLPADIDPTEGSRYLTRVYRFDKLSDEATRAQFEAGLVQEWKTQLGRQIKPNDLKKADGTMQDLAEHLSGYNLELETAAKEAVDNILGTPAGLVPDGVIPRVGVFKERKLRVDDLFLERMGVLDDDIDQVIAYYLRSTIPSMEIAERFGDRQMSELLGKLDKETGKITGGAIRDQYEVMIAKAQEAGNMKRAGVLRKVMEDDIKDITHLRDSMLGTNRAPWSPGIAALQAARGYQFVRLLGMMTISAIPDVGRIVMMNGVRRFADGIAKTATATQRFNLARHELKSMGVALDVVLNSRVRGLMELGDVFGSYHRWSAAAESATAKFSLFTGMNHWNAGWKQMAGFMAMQRVMRNADRLAKGGRLGKGEIKKMAQMGLDESYLRRIHREVTNNVPDALEDGVWLTQTRLWKDKTLARELAASILKEVDSTIVTPRSGGRPAAMTGGSMSAEVWKTLAQFKSFALESHNATLIAGLQQRDRFIVEGVMMSVTLGTASYVVRQQIKGYDVSDDPQQLIKEGIDRSGLATLATEIFNMGDAMSGGTFSEWMGGEPMTRYAARGKAGAILGPSGETLLRDVPTALHVLGTGKASEADIHTLRKMTPLSTHFALRGAFDRFEEGLREVLPER